MCENVIDEQLNVLRAALQAAAKAVLAMQQKPPDRPGAAPSSAPAPGQDREAALALSGEEAFARRAMYVLRHLAMLCISHSFHVKIPVWIWTTHTICSCILLMLIVLVSHCISMLQSLQEEGAGNVPQHTPAYSLHVTKIRSEVA